MTTTHYQFVATQLLSLLRRCECFRASGWLTPRQAFAEARNTMDLIGDSAAKTPIQVYKLRGGVGILEGSGGRESKGLTA